MSNGLIIIIIIVAVAIWWCMSQSEKMTLSGNSDMCCCRTCIMITPESSSCTQKWIAQKDCHGNPYNSEEMVSCIDAKNCGH